MICDICSKKGEFTMVSPDTVREAIHNGFNPYKLKLVAGRDSAMSMFSSFGLDIDSDEYEDMEFQKWAQKAEMDTTNWNLCDKCKMHLDFYL